MSISENDALQPRASRLTNGFIRTRYVPPYPETQSRPARLRQADFVRLSFLEQKTALSLVQMATDTGLDLRGDEVENLLGVLIVS